MKLGCDGTRPCNTCSYKGIECTFSRLKSKLVSLKQEENCKSLAMGINSRNTDIYAHARQQRRSHGKKIRLLHRLTGDPSSFS